MSSRDFIIVSQKDVTFGDGVFYFWFMYIVTYITCYVDMFNVTFCFDLTSRVWVGYIIRISQL